MRLTPIQRQRLQRLRWTAFALVATAYVLAFFHRVAPAAIADELQQSFAVSGTELGLLAASYFYIYTLMQVPTGVLVDTLGVRRVVTFGGFVAAIGSVLFGLAASLTEAALGRLLVGFGVSFMFLAMLKINALWFREHRFATMNGLTVLLGNVGAVLAAAPLVWALEYATWRSVFVGIGFFSMALAVLSWLLVRDTPRGAGLPSMRELEGLAPHAPHIGHWAHGLREVVRNRATWPGVFPAFGIAGTMLAFAGLWAIPFLRDVYGMEREWAAIHTTGLLAGFALGSLAIGSLSDRLQRRKPVLLGGCGLYLLCWLPLLAHWPLTPVTGPALFVLMGLGAAGFTLVWAVAKEVNRPALSGMATSVVNTGVFLGVAVLQPLVGYLMDRGWDGRTIEGVRIYTAANHRLGAGLLFVVALAGFTGALWMRETGCRQLPLKARMA